MRHGYEMIAFGFVLAYVALHVVFGLIAPRDAAWGFDILLYCRWWLRAIFFLLAAGAMSLVHPAAMARAETAWAWAGGRLSAVPLRLNLLKTHLVLFAFSAAVLFLLETKYAGGDARWMSASMPLFLKRSPLSSVPLVLGTRLGAMLGIPYLPSLQAGITVFGALSICGLLGLFLLLFRDARRAWLFVAVALASYGITRLLPGYIEVYGVYLFFLILFECALVHYCLTGRGTGYLMGALFLLVLSHIQALVVVPGAFLVGAGVSWRRGRRWRFAASWVLLIVALAVVYPLLRHRDESFQVTREVVGLVLHGDVHSRFWSTQGGTHLVAPLIVLLTARHWANVADVHALVSAVGVGLLLPGLALWWRERRADPLIVASALNYGLYAIGTVLFYNFLQPVERDWDMFGPGALFLVVLAAAIWRHLPHEKLRRTLLIVFGVTAFVTVLWLAQQAGMPGIAPPPEIRIGFTSPD